MKALHADPEFAAARDARLKALHADPELAAKQREAVSVHWDSDMDAALVAGLRAGTSLVKIAGIIGVCSPTMRKRMATLGLTREGA